MARAKIFRRQREGFVSAYRLPNTTDPYPHSTYANGTRASLAEMSCGKQQPRYASTMSLRSLDTAASGISNLRQLDFASASLVDLQDQLELQQQTRRRSPSLPPICNKNEYRYQVNGVVAWFARHFF